MGQDNVLRLLSEAHESVPEAEYQKIRSIARALCDWEENLHGIDLGMDIVRNQILVTHARTPLDLDRWLTDLSGGACVISAAIEDYLSIRRHISAETGELLGGYESIYRRK